MSTQITEADHQVRKHIQLDSLLNVIERELDDFSQNWDSDSGTIPQRFGDLFALVKSAKAVLTD
jgi:hypothetical protein